jgi:hypothetical protein
VAAEEKVYKAYEVAALFKVRTDSVLRWVRTGALPSEFWFHTPGGSVRIRQSGVDFIANAGGR